MENEEQNSKEIKTETTEANTNTGDKPKTASIIDAANSAAERLEKANEEAREILQQQRELEAKRILGGGTLGGDTEPKKVEDPIEYAKNALKGNIS